MSNTGDGVMIKGSRQATVGGSASGAGNQIVSNEGFGLEASGVCSGTVVSVECDRRELRGECQYQQIARYYLYTVSRRCVRPAALGRAGRRNETWTAALHNSAAQPGPTRPRQRVPTTTRE